MQFSHDNMTGVHLAVDLVNRVRPDTVGRDVETVLREHSIRRPALTASQAATLRSWTQELAVVITAADPDQRCRSVNTLLERATRGVYLTTHDGWRPHLHFTPDEDDVVGRVRAVTAGGLAIFTMEAGGARLQQCGRSGCNLVFVDTSRNGRRAYCSARCGNHDAVTRYRAR